MNPCNEDLFLRIIKHLESISVSLAQIAESLEQKPRAVIHYTVPVDEKGPDAKTD